MQVGKFLKKNIKRADQNKAVQGEFFLKINKPAGQIPRHMEGWNKHAGGIFFARFQILICETQSIWRKLLVLS